MFILMGCKKTAADGKLKGDLIPQVYTVDQTQSHCLKIIKW